MHNFITANSFLESVITMIKDERLNHKLSLSSFMDTLDQLKSFYEGSVWYILLHPERNEVKPDSDEKDEVPKECFDPDQSQRIVIWDLML